MKREERKIISRARKTLELEARAIEGMIPRLERRLYQKF